MLIDHTILFVFFLLIIPSSSYYLIDIDKNVLLNTSYCSNLLITEQLYRIPNQCHKHLLCNPYYCDDQSFRCMKIRETLCCIYKYFRTNCQDEDRMKTQDLFRSIYFHISIQHGYCEINLERIEKNDQSYCIANDQETTTAIPRLSFHRSNRYHHHFITRQNRSLGLNPTYLRRETIIERKISSKSSFIYSNIFFFIILLYTSFFSSN